MVGHSRNEALNSNPERYAYRRKVLRGECLTCICAAIGSLIISTYKDDIYL